MVPENAGYFAIDRLLMKHFLPRRVSRRYAMRFAGHGEIKLYHRVLPFLKAILLRDTAEAEPQHP